MGVTFYDGKKKVFKTKTTTVIKTIKYKKNIKKSKTFDFHWKIHLLIISKDIKGV